MISLCGLIGVSFAQDVRDWREWVTKYRDTHHCEGQVQTKDLLSRNLYQLARIAQGVLEVGTWRGCGSTLILAKGFIDQGHAPSKLQTLEGNQARAMETRQMLADLPVVNVSGAPAAASYDI